MPASWRSWRRRPSTAKDMAGYSIHVIDSMDALAQL
jgi:hypothetical protein